MFIENLLEASIRLSVPVLFVALGELISQRGGIVNIGLEGFMSAGAFASFAVMAGTNDPTLAILAGILAGIAASSIMSIFAVWGRINQILIGFALFIMVPGLTSYLAQQRIVHGSVSAFDPIAIPVLSELPLVGSVLFTQNGFFYGACIAAVLVTALLNRTRFGLSLSACGHDPEVANSKGINVAQVRTLGLILTGALAGIGGAALAVGALGSFTPGVTEGRGFIAIALVILGRWRTSGVVIAAFAIGAVDALRIQLGGIINLPGPLLAMAPWIVVLVMLIAGARTSKMPPALGKDMAV